MLTFVEDEPPDITNPFPGTMLDRAAFDAALVREAVASGAQCRFATTVRGIGTDGHVTLGDGRAVDGRRGVALDVAREVHGHVPVGKTEQRQLAACMQAGKGILEGRRMPREFENGIHTALGRVGFARLVKTLPIGLVAHVENLIRPFGLRGFLRHDISFVDHT